MKVVFVLPVLVVAVSAFAGPSLIPQPKSVKWHDGMCDVQVPVVERLDRSVPPEGYRELFSIKSYGNTVGTVYERVKEP